MATTPRPDPDAPLERHPHGGEEPSDVDVQAERQEEGVEAEIEEEVVEDHRRRLAEREAEAGRSSDRVPPGT